MPEAPVVSGPQESTHIEISTTHFFSPQAISLQQTSLNDQKLAPQLLQTNHSYYNTKIPTKSVYK